MPKPQSQRTAKAKKPQFGEVLTPARPLAPAVSQLGAPRSALIKYGSWALASILAGIAFGLLVRSLNAPTALQITPGTVAIVTNAAIGRVLTAKELAVPMTESVNLQPVDATGITAASTITVPRPAVSLSASDNLQPATSSDAVQAQTDANAFQAGFSAYGVQGSVGTAHTR